MTESQHSPSPELGKHGFSGSCAPGNAFAHSGQETFSVGIFEWLPKSSGSGLKRGPVKVRVKGRVNMELSAWMFRI